MPSDESGTYIERIAKPYLTDYHTADPRMRRRLNGALGAGESGDDFYIPERALRRNHTPSRTGKTTRVQVPLVAVIALFIGLTAGWWLAVTYHGLWQEAQDNADASWRAAEAAHDAAAEAARREYQASSQSLQRR